MQNVIVKSLLLLIASLSLIGCASTPVRNSTPDPVFPPCAVINGMGNSAVSDAIIDNQVESTNVMLKLRDRQPSDEQVKFGKCELPKPV